MAETTPSSECSIAATLDVIGDRWTLLVLRDLFRGVRRFSDLVDDLGIAKNLLSDRLKRLVEHEIVEKILYQDRPARYEYRLTAKGADLSPSLIALMRWGDEWYAVGEPPVVLVHEACGTPLEQHVQCPRCDERVSPGKVRSQSQQDQSHPDQSHPDQSHPDQSQPAGSRTNSQQESSNDDPT